LSAGTQGPRNKVQTVDVPFNWLVHLDRQLISPMELLHVSSLPPWELTKRFASPGPDPTTGTTVATLPPFPGNQPVKPSTHYAPWGSETAQLYRFFHAVKTKELAADAGLNGRYLGLVNLNTVGGGGVLSALADAQTTSPFTDAADVSNFFSSL